MLFLFNEDRPKFLLHNIIILAGLALCLYTATYPTEIKIKKTIPASRNFPALKYIFGEKAF